MTVTVDWGNLTVHIARSEMLLVQSVPVEIRQLDLTSFRYALHDIQDSEAGMVYPTIHTHNSSVTVAGVTLAQVVEIVNNYTITFEDGLYNVNIVGGNSNVADRVNKNQVGVNTANSAGLQDSASLQAASFGGVVAIDVINGVAGDTFPIGTKGTPSSNTADALKIANLQNIDTLFILGDITLGAGDNVDGYIVTGSNPTNTLVTVDTLASTVGTEFREVTLTGILDGGSVVRSSLIYDIAYVNGFLVDCVLGAGTITLGGGATALFMRCVSGVSGTSTPIIDMGGSGQSLGMRDYNGGITIINKSGDDPFSLDIASGTVILDPTVTNGVMVCRGVGKLKNYSTGTSLIVNEMLNGAEVANAQKLIELQRPSHAALGSVWYWDPYDGDDLNDGDHITRGVKTFAKAHDLATSGRGDLIIALSTDPSGTTVTNENIVMSKDDILLRGQGESFEIRSADDNLDGIHISGHGCEVSSMTLGTSATSTRHCVYITNSNNLLKDLVLTDAVDGIDIFAGEYNTIKNVKCHHNLGYGIEVGGTAQHTDILDCHIGGNAGDGIRLVGVDAHEVVIGGDTVIHKNTGYGVYIGSTMTNVTIGKDVSVFFNTAGDVEDLGTGTYMRSALTTTESELLARTANIEAKVYINTELLVVGEGTQSSPFNNFNTAKDYCEANGIYVMVAIGECTITSSFKNFTLEGVGVPLIHTNGQILDNSKFYQCSLSGAYTGTIIAQDCSLLSGFVLQGFFETCMIIGDLICNANATVLVANCFSGMTGVSSPTLDMNTGTPTKLSVRNYSGGLTVLNADHIDDECTIEVSQGSLTFDVSCVLGSMVARGVGKFVDESNGSTVINEMVDPLKVATKTDVISASQY